MIRKWLLTFASMIFVHALILSTVAAPSSEPARVNVILWFDTEDYLLPADDDASLRLAQMLTQRGIPATFKIVGEKARTLERRGRKDVIEALKKHSIAYHSDFHSVHPTPSEYLAECGLLDGIAEFVRREGDGAADIRRIFGVETLSCYGQPGSSWGPQTMAGLKQIGVAPAGVPCYVDEGDHIGLDQKPFWYEGALTVYHMGQNYTRMELHDPAAVEPAQRKVSEIAARLARQDGGGLISIFYHPCEWVHREFWDGVNFARGRNPPREQWQPPPQRTAEETEGAFKRFAEYIDYIQTIPGVRFITASDLPVLYPDTVRTQGATAEELALLTRTLLQQGRFAAGESSKDAKQAGLDFQVIGAKAFSVADQFELLTLAVTQMIEGKNAPLIAVGLLGPDAPPPAAATELSLAWPAFRDAVLDVRDFIRNEKRVPARVFVGADAVPPADFLLAMAAVYEHHLRTGLLPESDGVILGKNVALLPTRYVAEDRPNLFGGWIIHKEGFRAPKILEVARLQTWTLKPALRK